MCNFLYVNILEQRSSGILLPVFSLPGSGGIGDLGPSSHNFIDFLKRSCQNCWQILPVTPTSLMFGNSPYMSSSAFAGSSLLISLDLLVEAGWLSQDEILSPDFSEYTVDYSRVALFKKKLLTLAWKRFRTQPNCRRIIEEFTEAQPWARDYGLFVALKEQYQEQPWYSWPLPLQQRDPQHLLNVTTTLRHSIELTIFSQYVFYSQWQDLRAYAREQGISIIGDLPIYVALDSADVWVHQELFQLDRSTGKPTHVAGVPPDYFSATGQRWGNPLYRWNSANKETTQELWNWWEQRLRHNFSMVNTLRIDHFRGFDAYWSIPANEDTAINGCWLPGPGQRFFEEMEQRLGTMSIIAEDLGVITPEVETLRNNLGYPGMNVLLFAFDGNPENSYLPYNMEKNSVVYTGTHDNDTAVGWYLNPDVDKNAKYRAKRFTNRFDDHAGTFHQELIHLAFASPANLAILPMQDVLGFGNDCRMNTPGTTTNNWQWRCADTYITDEVADWLAELTGLFGRTPRPPQCIR